MSPDKPRCGYDGCTSLANQGGRYCNRHALATGTMEHLVPAARCRDHLEHLTTHGANLDQVSAQIGVSRKTLWKISTGRQGLVRPSTEALICAAVPVHSAVRPPAWPSRRRVHSLMAAGHSLAEIAGLAGVSVRTVAKIASDEDALHVSPATAAGIARAWHTLRREPVAPPDPRVAAHGWPVPWEWDRIDDPQETRGSEPDQVIHHRIRIRRKAA